MTLETVRAGMIENFSNILVYKIHLKLIVSLFLIVMDSYSCAITTVTSFLYLKYKKTFSCYKI